MGTETELAAPTFLIAVPQLSDPNFARAVVLILEHGDQGSMGLVVNRTSSLPMGAFCASQGMDYQGDPGALVYQGGPVQTDRAFVLHSQQQAGPETEEIWGGVCLSYSLESLRVLVDEPPERLRMYLGYAGWGPGQLADEISGGGWLLSCPTSQVLFNTEPENMWEAALAELHISPVQLIHSGRLH